MKRHTQTATPEYASIEAFVQHVADDLEPGATAVCQLADVEQIAKHTGMGNHAVIAALRGYGIALAERRPARHRRGFLTSSHDRWFGPGSSPTHGGSGYEQITGFAGARG
jgi:hypothetical protein